MDTRLAILSAAAFAGVVLGGAVVAEPGLAAGLSPASVWSSLRGSGGNDDTRLVQQSGNAPAQGGEFTNAQFTTGTRSHDEHESGRTKGDARSSSRGTSGEHEDDGEEEDHD